MRGFFCHSNIYKGRVIYHTIKVLFSHLTKKNEKKLIKNEFLTNNVIFIVEGGTKAPPILYETE